MGFNVNENSNTWEIKPMPKVVKWGSGGTPKSSEKAFYNGDIPWLIIGDLNDNIVFKSEKSITELGLDNCNAKMLKKGTLLLAMYGSIGKLGITGFECCTNQAIAFAKELYGVTAKYMFYYLKFIKPKLFELGKGGTQKNISLTVINSLSVPVPPLSEQNRIVDKLDELFSELDNGIETLQKTKAQLKVYKQAVLKDAFFNTEAEMIYVKLTEFIEKPRYGTSKKCDYYTEENYTAVYRIPNIDIKTSKINHDDIKFAKFDIEETEALKLQIGDILIIRSNGSISLVGRAAIITEQDTKGIFAGYLMRLRLKKDVQLTPEYLLHYLSSHEARTYIEQTAKSTSGVNNINSTEISNLIVPYCVIDEQKKIIEKIESRLSICDQIEKTVDESLRQAESLRQSILKQAFEGSLV